MTRAPVPDTNGTALSVTNAAGYRVTGGNARFVWERKLRDDEVVPRHLKGFLLLVGTYMNNDGGNALPSATKLATQFGLSRQRVFELLAEAETTGWLITRARPGKPSERLPATPEPPLGQLTLEITPPITRQTGLTGTRQTHLTGQPPADYNPTYNPSDPSDPTRQTGLTGTPDPSDRSDPTVKKQDPRTDTDGGTLPPNPLRPAAPPAPRTDRPTARSAVG